MGRRYVQTGSDTGSSSWSIVSSFKCRESAELALPAAQTNESRQRVPDERGSFRKLPSTPRFQLYEPFFSAQLCKSWGFVCPCGRKSRSTELGGYGSHERKRLTVAKVPTALYCLFLCFKVYRGRSGSRYSSLKSVLRHHDSYRS